MKRRLLSIFLALALCLTLLPLAASATTASSLQDAINQGLVTMDGDTIKMLDNVELTAPIVINNDTTLNLSNTLSISSDTGDAYAIVVANGTLTIIGNISGSISTASTVGNACGVLCVGDGTVDLQNNPTITASAPEGKTAAKTVQTDMYVIFDPLAGRYDEPQTVTISCTEEGATIHYTMDGSDPTTESATYTGPVTVDETATLKAMAVLEGLENSPIATAAYTIDSPTEEPETGYTATGVSVTINGLDKSEASDGIIRPSDFETQWTVAEEDAPENLITGSCTQLYRSEEMTGTLEKLAVYPGVTYYFKFFWQPVKAEGKPVDFSELTPEDCSGTMTGFTLEPIKIDPAEETDDCYAGIAVTFKATMDAEYDFTFIKPYFQSGGVSGNGSYYATDTWEGSSGSWEGALPPANLIDGHGSTTDPSNPLDLIFTPYSTLYTDPDLTNLLTSEPVDGGEYYFRVSWEQRYGDQYIVDFSKIKLEDIQATVNGYKVEAYRMTPDYERTGIRVWFKLTKIPEAEIQSYPLWVGGTQVTDSNAADVLRNRQVSYVAATNTLILDNATIPARAAGASDAVNSGIYYEGEDTLKLNVTGTNTVTGNDTPADLSGGSGTFGLCADNADVEITLNNATLTLNGGASEKFGYASYGMFLDGDLTVTGSGTINAVGGNASDSASGGLSTMGNISIGSGCTFNATGGDAQSNSFGLFLMINDAPLTLSLTGDAAMTCVGGEGTKASYGIYLDPIASEGTLTLSAPDWTGSLTAQGNTAAMQGYIDTDGKTTSTFTRTVNQCNMTGYAEIADTEGTVLLEASYDMKTDLTGYKKIVFSPASVITYTVSFDANGGEGTMEPQTFICGEAQALSPNTFTYTGHTFDGWNTQPNGSGDAYEDSTEVIDLTDEADGTVTLYAQWAENTYTVSFDANGGEGTMEPVSDVSGAYVLPACGFTAPSGKTFDKWKDADGTTYAPGDSVDITADTTFTATWKDKSSGSAGGSAGSATLSYPVNVPSDTENGTVTVSPASAAKGKPVTITAKPDEGYKTDSVTVADKNGKPVELKDNGDGTYTFTMPDGPVDVKATFTEDSGATPPAPSDKEKFVDVAKDAWYHDPVYWALDKGVTNGTDDTHFSPDMPCTRGQMVTFLWRAAGEPVVNYAMPFTDLEDGAYYTEAIRWAASEGITNGMDETHFVPDGTVNRAQTVTFLYRYEQSQGGGFTGAWAFPLDYSDASDVPEWAYEAFCWMTMENVIQGTDGKLLPGDDCLRSQIVTMLCRYFSEA